jgi:mannan endo-1,4-beta-mannosidase
MKQFLLLVALASLLWAAGDRYEAEDAIVDENSVVKVESADASGGYYVNMKEGTLSFAVNISSAGFYAIRICYSQPNDSNQKIQNLTVNGVAKGQISFPYSEPFVAIKGFAKVNLSAGDNTIGIVKSWGWVNIDYIELTPFVETPFTITASPVTPKASENAIKMYGFLRDQFQKKTISGVMTNTVFFNDGKYTPYKVEEQTEVAWIIDASGKTPALLGLDFMHATGKSSDQQWHQGYTAATLAMAEDIYKKGGFPAYCWHWKDPLKNIEAFYSASSGNTDFTDFNLNRAFMDSTTCTAFNTSSKEYTAIVADIDIIAAYLKTLAQKNIPILWRPMHEASGRWFWWGYSGPKACVALYRFLFYRLVNHHGLNNLIWVWTTDEAADALDWYPGDEYVDIVGRDYYYYPREANHGSLVASFENVKDIFGGRKLIALSENGSIPHPDSMATDGAGWSYFMPWYGDYTMDGWAHDNTAADWNSIMNNSRVITLDAMPGWEKYTVPATVSATVKTRPSIAVRVRPGYIEITSDGIHSAASAELLNIRGARIVPPTVIRNGNGIGRIAARTPAGGLYIVRVTSSEGAILATQPVPVR